MYRGDQMIISELISRLEELKENHGDLPVRTFKNHPTDGIYDGHYNFIEAKFYQCRFIANDSCKCIDLITEGFE